MTSPERNREKYEDALFSILMQNAMDAEGSALHIHNKTYSQDEIHAVSPETDARCHAAIERGFEERARRKKKRTYKRVFRTLLIAALVSTLLFTTVCASVPELKNTMLEIWIEMQYNCATFSFNAGEKEEDEPVSDEDTMFGFEMPSLDGSWKLIEKETDPYYSGRTYKKDGTSFIIGVQRISESTQYNVMTDSAEVSDIAVNGYHGLLVIWNDELGIYLYDKEHSLIIEGVFRNMTWEEAVDIMSLIRFVG